MRGLSIITIIIFLSKFFRHISFTILPKVQIKNLQHYYQCLDLS